MTDTPETVTVNGRDYAWPKQPVVVVCIDGSEPDYIERAVADGAMPFLGPILKTGSNFRADCVVPSFTNPNNISIVTGVPPVIHGIGANFFFDRDSGEVVCIVDLDTVMPGLVHYDFGDMVRTLTSPTNEDERDLTKVTMRMEYFEELAKGYLAEASEFLTQADRDYLAISGKVITLILGIRFLTDHLNGDTYFRVHRDGQNLDRARVQFKLVESMLEQEEAMKSFIAALG